MPVRFGFWKAATLEMSRSDIDNVNGSQRRERVSRRNEKGRRRANVRNPTDLPKGSC